MNNITSCTSTDIFSRLGLLSEFWNFLGIDDILALSLVNRQSRTLCHCLLKSCASGQHPVLRLDENVRDLSSLRSCWEVAQKIKGVVRDMCSDDMETVERAVRFCNERMSSPICWLRIIRDQGINYLLFAPENLRSSKAFILALVKRNAWVLTCASDDLRNDEDVVFAAVRQCGEMLQYASTACKSRLDIVLAAVKRHGLALRYAGVDLRGNREAVFAAVKQDGSALQYASDALRDDGDVVFAAMEQNGHVLQYASNRLRNDPEFVLAAIQRKSEAIGYIGDELRASGDFRRQVSRIFERMQNQSTSSP